MPAPFLVLDLPDEAATEALAEAVAGRIGRGDLIALFGDLGAGKTTFARALIRRLANDATLEVPSPTFTLVQTYATPRLTVAHIDLYRIADPREIDETGLGEALAEGAALVEWPERAEGLLPDDRLDITMDIDGAGRRASLASAGDWGSRMAGFVHRAET